MVKKSLIKKIKAREVLDSRGNPTVEVALATSTFFVRASVPSGASKGKYEAVAKPAKMAVKNINKIIGPKIIGKDPTRQKEIDEFLIKLDGTKNKSRLGANAILAVSMAVCRAGAKAQKIPLYKCIFQLYETRQRNLRKLRNPATLKLPWPCFNVINGGAHAKNGLDIQEFMIIPQFPSFKKSFFAGIKIFNNLKKILKKNFGKSGIKTGDEGGFTPPIKKTEEALNFLVKAIKSASYSGKVKIGLDCAASQFFKKGRYELEGENFSREKLINFYQNLIEKYPIIFIEDPFAEEDHDAWSAFQCKMQNAKYKIQILGDDLTVTNPNRIKLAQKKKACNGVIIKPNQVGTITETIEAAKLAKSFGWKIVVSHRSGETLDDFIADLAVGVGADFIKSGAPLPKERMIKYNRLIQIEKQKNGKIAIITTS